jgi:hypothetical protein
MKKAANRRISRRDLIKTVAVAAPTTLAGFPSIVPASMFGAAAPGNRINVGAIGVGRISRAHDLPNIWRQEAAQIVAVCDVDSKRMEDAKVLVNDYYTRKSGKPFQGVAGYLNYRALLSSKDVDAVVISTPDHWHALIGIGVS